MNILQELLGRNTAWAEKIKQDDPDFFAHLSGQQRPHSLWIGCSDSRVPSSQILDLPPGEVFVHRNIANIVSATDINCLSVIQYAVQSLTVKHIIICGHYECGGVLAALQKNTHGTIDQWLQPIKKISDLYNSQLENLSIEQKHKKLCELNVFEQVRNVCSTDIVQEAWENGQELSVHGLIYSIEKGTLLDLKISCNSVNEFNKLHLPELIN